MIFLIGSSYMKLSKELAHSRKGLGLINIQNTNDYECYKQGIVSYLNPADRNTARITNGDKDFAIKLFLKTYIFQSKLETFTKLKNIILSTSVFLAIKIKKII